MKKHLFAIAALGLLLTTVSAYGQSIRLKADIPFEFVAERATLPAGEYTLQSLGPERSLLIRNVNNSMKSIVMANHCQSAQPAEQTKLVFRKYGDRYFLAQVWVEGNTSGHEFAPSRREREVAQDFTMQQVVLVASLH